MTESQNIWQNCLRQAALKRRKNISIPEKPWMT